MRMFWLLLRWSSRDLRARWPVVTAIALVAAIGTGTFASLNSMSAWRHASNDASFAATRMHDLRVAFDAAAVDRRRISAALAEMPHAASVSGADVRLRLPVQVETADGSDIRSGIVIGMDHAGTGPKVDTVHRRAGRALTAADEGHPMAVAEYNYAKDAGLAPSGRLILSGRSTVSYVGTGLAPEYLFNGFPLGGFSVPTGLAVLFMPLTSAEALAGAPGQVNDLVLTLRPGTDRALVEGELREALGRQLPGMPFTMTTREQDPTYELLYQDADSDRESFLALALLVLLGATLAAFNLTTRVVQAQRRQIGVQMALGASPRLIAVRPVLFGLQVSALGAVAGVGVGLAMNAWIGGLLAGMLPLPVWDTGFQPDLFAEAALIGLLLPFLGALLPVLRVLRTEPVQAIRTGPRAQRRGWLSRLGGRIRLPGRTLLHLPLREVLRAPLRPLMTAVGVGAAIATIIGMFGSVDVMNRTFERAEAELGRSSPRRVTVTMDGYYPTASPQVTAITGDRLFSRAEPGLLVPVSAVHGGRALDLTLSVQDLRSGLWTPTLTGTTVVDVRQGMVLTGKAAGDLGVRPGDTVTVRHAARQGKGFRQADTAMRVVALTPYPLREAAYLDTSGAAALGLAGLANVVRADPAGRPGLVELRRGLLPHAGAAAVQRDTGTVAAFRESMDEFLEILRVLEVIALLLVLLIAFNAAGLNADERAREHATMFAFGYRPRAALGEAMAEGFLVGTLGTLFGLGLGYLALLWITGIRIREFPELEIVPALSPGTAAFACAVGIVLVTFAPVLTLRRLRRMDLPATLRVIE